MGHMPKRRPKAWTPPAGRRTGDSARKLATGPLTALIYVVGGAGFTLAVVIIIAVAAGIPSWLVWDRVWRLWEHLRGALIWLIATTLAAAIPMVLRRIEQIGGLQRLGGEQGKELVALRAELADHRAQWAADRADREQEREADCRARAEMANGLDELAVFLARTVESMQTVGGPRPGLPPARDLGYRMPEADARRSHRADTAAQAAVGQVIDVERAGLPDAEVIERVARGRGQVQTPDG